MERVEQFTFVDAPASAERSALGAIKASTRNQGTIVDSLVRELDPSQGDALVTIVAIRPRGSATTMALFASILTDAAVGARQGGGTGKVSRAVNGQAYRLDAGGVDAYFSPVGTEPLLVLLVVTGPPSGPSQRVVAAILRANSP